MATATRRAALYVRVSTSDRGQTVENQLEPLQEAAGRLGWSIVSIYQDEGVSGAKGRQTHPVQADHPDHACGRDGQGGQPHNRPPINGRF
jgi:hypothetical protein